MIKDKIIKKILDNNQPITIEQYIEYCLYDNHGYYTNNKLLGKSGDFITAPEISQLFGEIIGLGIYSLWEKIINQSLNETLSRTIITSLTTLIVVVVLYIWGGNVLQPFALALIIGVMIGTYSSLFIASPIMLFLDEKFNIDTEDKEEK